MYACICVFDFDETKTIDLYEFAKFKKVVTGPDGSFDPDCAAGTRNRDGYIDWEDSAVFPSATTRA